MAKVCESLRLAYSLKAKWRDGCFQAPIKSLLFTVHVFGSVPWHKGDLRKRVVDLFRLEKVTKLLKISKKKKEKVWTPQSKVRQTVYERKEFKTIVMWPTNKDHSRPQCVIIHEARKEPRVHFKKLKAFLTLANVNVYVSTMEQQWRAWQLCSPERTLVPIKNLLRITGTS